MRSLFLAPHNDDETLFGAFTLLLHRPHVVVCLRSMKQAGLWGIWTADREAETAAAMGVLGCTWEQWDVRDDLEQFDTGRRLSDAMEKLAVGEKFDKVFAPAVVDGGQWHHNLVGELALEIFGLRAHVWQYGTYRNGRGRDSENLERVTVEPEWVPLKLEALACYRTQASIQSTGHHFLADQNEYLRGPV